MSINVTKTESELLSKLQRDIHTPLDENDELISPFCYQYEKITWHSHIPAKLQSTTTEGEGIATYNLNTSFHHLLYGDLKQELPKLKVKAEFKDKVEICWTHNVGHHVIKDCHFKFGEQTYYLFDNIWLDINAQYTIDNIEQYNEDIGNNDFLQLWSNRLPKYSLYVPQPWFFSRSEKLAFPLMLCQGQSVSFQYSLRNKVTDLLRMRIKTDDGTWKHIVPNLGYLEPVVNDGVLKLPEIWVRYSYGSSLEKDWNTCITHHEYYIETITPLCSLNPIAYEQNVAIEIEGKTPCKAIFWVGQNVDSDRLRCFGNYTTDITNVYDGYGLIEKVSINHSAGSRVKDMDGKYFERMEPLHHSKKRPHEKGYYLHSLGQTPFKSVSDVGLVPDNLKMRAYFTINDTNPLLDREEELKELKGEEDPTRFHVHIRLLSIKKMTFDYDTDKKVYNFDIHDE